MTIALDAALSGLRVAQQALDVASRNISNAATPGYTRKILPQESLVVVGIGLGVKSRPLSRSVNYALITDINRQNALAANYATRLGYLDRIQDYFGTTDSGRSISSKVTGMAEAFALLSTTPNDPTLLGQVVLKAGQVASTINGFSKLLTSLRNDTETDIISAVNEINEALNSIASLNQQIEGAINSGQDAVDLEDLRDTAIKTVSKYIDITTFRNESQIHVITRQGDVLANSQAQPLFFQRSNILPSSYYPGGGLTGLKIGGASGTDITQTYLGGKMSALFELRDTTLPQYIAQLDEFSQKMAMRFENEGLKMFTDINGNVPLDAPPAYVGFSQNIQVNNAVVNDPTLLRNGTTGNIENSGSNEVIRRISQFAFGTYEYQQVNGTVDISVGALIPLLGLTTQTVVTGNVNLAAYTNMGLVPGLTTPSSFDLTIGVTTNIITVLATDTAADIVNNINVAFGSTVAKINSLGNLQVYSNNNVITFADNLIPGPGVGAGGMAALGFSFGTTNPPNSSFQVQIGTRTPVSVSIAPGDTSVQLLAALNAIPGVTASLDGGGRLVIVPTDGGDLKITDIVGTALASMGAAITNIAHVPFRQVGLGPDGTAVTGLLANSTLQDYINGLITTQSEDHNVVQNSQGQEDSFLKTLEARESNLSGVNIDQEMSELIRIQSNYTAAAKMITATQQMLDDLFSTIR